jgi:hypothetical protein
MATDVSEERYFDLDGLAEYCGLSVKTLRRFMNDPVNPLPNHYVHGGERERGRIFVSKREFDAWIATFPPVAQHAAGRLTERVAAAVKSMRGGGQ